MAGSSLMTYMFLSYSDRKQNMFLCELLNSNYLLGMYLYRMIFTAKPLIDTVFGHCEEIELS